jgi:hypothetical protein
LKNSKFDIDLAKGQEMEKTFEEFMKGTLVEVKSERHIWEKTGNHFVEFECRGKPSGIAVTEADYWAVMLVKEIDGKDIPVMTYIVPIDVMKNLARELYHAGKQVKGGDDNASVGVLVKIKDIALASLNNV